jgi:Bacterial Ig domain
MDVIKSLQKNVRGGYMKSGIKLHRISNVLLTVLAIIAMLTVALPSNAALTIFEEDFEIPAPEWIIDNDVWGIGEAVSGPKSAFSGENCAATVLDGNYPYGQDSRLISPQMTLPEASSTEEILFQYWQWFIYASNDKYGSVDRGYIQIQVLEDEAWTAWETIRTSARDVGNAWSFASIDLTTYAGNTVRVAFYHQDGTEDPNGYEGYHHYESAGWYIDDIAIIKQERPQARIPEDFETDWGGWSAVSGIWGRGKPEAGPKSGYNSDNCVGTVLNGNYGYRADSRLISSQMVLPYVDSNKTLLLRFWHWFSYASTDYGKVQICEWLGDTWGEWEDLFTTGAGASDGWSHVYIDFMKYTGKLVRIAFYHQDITEDPNGYEGYHHYESAGWYIDDIELITEANDFENGISLWEVTTSGDVPYSLSTEYAHSGDFSFKVGPSPCYINCFDDYTVSLKKEFYTPVYVNSISAWVYEEGNLGGKGYLFVNGQQVDSPDLSTRANDQSDQPGWVKKIWQINGQVSTITFYFRDLTVSNPMFIDDIVIALELYHASPILTPINDQEVAEGGTLNVPVAATDPDSDDLTLSVSDLPSFGTFTDNGDGTSTIVLNPILDTSGYYVLTVTASDGTHSASDSFTLKVNNTNQPPELAPIDDQEMDETHTLTVLASATDPDFDTVTLSVSDLPSFGTFTDNGDGTGTIVFNPGDSDTGVYPMTVTASDANSSVLHSFTLTVNDSSPVPYSADFSVGAIKIAVGKEVNFTDESE